MNALNGMAKTLDGRETTKSDSNSRHLTGQPGRILGMAQDRKATAEVVEDYANYVAGGFAPLPVS
jgi:hypothetical protein